MKKNIFFLFLLILSIAGFSQDVRGKLNLQQGQVIEVNMQVKTTIAQQVMGQAIDFDVQGSSLHSYKVTNATADNNTLHHQVQRLTFNFDGMGQKRSFDSNIQKDMDGEFGKPMKELLGKTYDMVIDPAANVLMVKPEKFENAKMDGPMMLVSGMLKDVIDVVQPPQKNGINFFKVLPEKNVSKGSSWSETFENVNGKFNYEYTLTGITDTSLIIDFSGNSVTKSKTEMMGSEAITIMNNKTTGHIILDKASGIIKEKTSITESNGTMEVMGNSVPVTSKIKTLITVK